MLRDALADLLAHPRVIWWQCRDSPWIVTFYLNGLLHPNPLPQFLACISLQIWSTLESANNKSTDNEDQLFVKRCGTNLFVERAIACRVIIISFFDKRRRKKQFSGNNLFLGSTFNAFLFEWQRKKERKKAWMKKWDNFWHENVKYYLFSYFDKIVFFCKCGSRCHSSKHN